MKTLVLKAVDTGLQGGHKTVSYSVSVSGLSPNKPYILMFWDIGGALRSSRCVGFAWMTTELYGVVLEKAAQWNTQGMPWYFMSPECLASRAASF
jgi:hypothetical protein